MVAIVNEEYTWKPTIINVDANPDPAPEQSVRVYVFDDDGTIVVNGDTVTTDAQGTITTQNLQNAIYSDSGSGFTTNDETPHTIVLSKYSGTTGFNILRIQSSISQGTTPTFYISENPYITISEATVSGYTNISINDALDEIIVSSARTMTELYHFVFREDSFNPEYDYEGIIQTSDGNSYSSAYLLEVSAGTLNLEGKTLNLGSSLLIVSGTGNITNGTIIVTTANVNAEVNFSNISFQGDVYVNTGLNSSLTWSNVSITSGNVHNNAASNTLVIQATNGSSFTAFDPGTGNGETDVQNAINIDIKVIDEDKANIQSAQVLVEADTGGTLPADELHIIAGSSGTATVSHLSHGLSTGDKIAVRDHSNAPLNGVKTITVTGPDSYTYSYTGSNSGGSNGSITYVFDSTTTNVNGEVSITANYGTDQPVRGTVRKATTGTKYKTGTFSGTITSSGFSTTVTLLNDE